MHDPTARIISPEQALRERLTVAESNARTSSEKFRFIHPTSASAQFFASPHRVTVEIPGRLLARVKQLDTTGSVVVVEETPALEIRFEDHLFVTSDPKVAAYARELIANGAPIREILAGEDVPPAPAVGVTDSLTTATRIHKTPGGPQDAQEGPQIAEADSTHVSGGEP